MTLIWLRKILMTFAALCVPNLASAQTTPAPPAEDEPELVEFDTAKVRRIAVPSFVAANPADTAAGNSSDLSRQIAEVIAANLRNSGLFEPQGPAGIRTITLGEVTAPQYDYWKGRNAEQGAEHVDRAAQGALNHARLRRSSAQASTSSAAMPAKSG